MNLNDLKSVFIIAEAGINHGGSLKEGLKLIDIATNCKADAIKFQTFKPSEISSKFVENVDYIRKATDKSNIEILTDLSLSYKKFRVLKNYADKKEFCLCQPQMAWIA